jgi:hypothetical protein
MRNCSLCRSAGLSGGQRDGKRQVAAMRMCVLPPRLSSLSSNLTSDGVRCIPLFTGVRSCPPARAPCQRGAARPREEKCRI